MEAADAAGLSALTICPMCGRRQTGRSGNSASRARTLWLALSLTALILCSCSSTATPTADSPALTNGSESTAPRGSTPPGSTPGTSRVADQLLVEQTAVHVISYEHWVNGASVIDSAYDWGVLINNRSDHAAKTVALKASFTNHGAVVSEQKFLIDSIPPGQLACSTDPIIANNSAAADGVQVTLTPTEWTAPPAGAPDALAQSDRVSIGDWKGELRVEPGDDPHTLIAFVAYFSADDKLIAVDPNHIYIPEARQSRSTPLPIKAAPAGGEPNVSYVRVFLARVLDPGGLLPQPLQVTKPDVDAAATRWQANGPASYTWRVRRDCFCNGATLDITVENHRVVDVKVADPGRGGSYPPEAAQQDALTIDDLLANMDRTIAGGDPVYAEFDPALGYPRRVTLTSRLPDGGDSFDTIDFRSNSKTPTTGGNPP